MGQKVHPIGFRLGTSKTWTSRWYARKSDYPRMVQEDIRIRRFLEKRYDSAGVARIEIERAAKNLRVNLYSSRPGIIIGKGGSGAEKLREEMKRACNLDSGDPTINVYEIKKPDLEAKLVADGIRAKLEKRASFRRAMKQAMSQAMRAGARGVRICCAGRLGGADMSRREWYMEGRVPLHTLRADIDFGTAEAATTYGIIGIKVWIFRGEVLD